MAWISQLLPTIPRTGPFPNVKVGPDMVDQTTQVHLLVIVIPPATVIGMVYVLVGAAVVKLKAISAPLLHMTVPCGQPTRASSNLWFSLLWMVY